MSTPVTSPPPVGAGTTRTSVAVVVCTYTLDRFEETVAAAGSLLDQDLVPDEVVVVVDHHEELRARLREQLPSQIRVVASAGPRGLSGARNTGVAATTADVVLFLDDDAVADAGWVSAMLTPFTDDGVVGVAGWAEPAWAEPGPPRWFPAAFLWVVGCSYEGLPADGSRVRNPIGAAMGFRRDAVMAAGGFSAAMGRVGSLPVGCEETEMAIRVAEALPEGQILLARGATVLHRVGAPRRSLRYFVRRCYWEGVSKAVVSAHVGSGAALETERSYVARTLPAAAGRGVLDALRGDLTGLGRSCAVTLGLAATGTGYLRGRATGRRAVPVPVAAVGEAA
ncbi:glycosyltransferase family 2 protein [Nocardioides bruguierae]|uniref:Glycosyltransferase n=1 Tax=Nocardioides bruguierae TaxID=2945102 RepID=A0A9X2IH72_9ACTN|nr:glycosyltransferase family 2 protein [Nocardioides bruguierae]MCL8026146.1 glycosyltransferase [Nocardioides bruguierae]MCM0621490.1 glycosyltransferase [Nocardioides bruguierae]